MPEYYVYLRIWRCVFGHPAFRHLYYATGRGLKQISLERCSCSSGQGGGWPGTVVLLTKEFDMQLQYEIGQVWCIQWDNGDPLTPESYERQALLLGIDYDTQTGDPRRLHFGVGMTPNSKAGSISPSEFQRHNPILVASPGQ